MRKTRHLEENGSYLKAEKKPLSFYTARKGESSLFLNFSEGTNYLEQRSHDVFVDC